MIKEVFVILSLATSVNNNFNPNVCEHSLTPVNTIFCESPSIMVASNESHPFVEGMNYYSGFNRVKAGDKSSGYYYYDFNAYYTNFTNVSRLYLINVKVDFTSGYIATQNSLSGYDRLFDLDKGYVHLAAVNRFMDEGDVSSSVKYLTSWPSSSSSVSSVSSGFSNNFTLSWQDGISLNWPNGVEAYVQRTSGVSIQINHSTTITTDEPYVSTQTSPNNALERQWNYQYKAIGKATYTLDTFYLVEVKNDSIGFNKFGFVFDIFLNMSNVKWKNAWWESHDPQNYSIRVYLGLGRNPGR